MKELDLDPVVLPGDKGDFIVTVESNQFCTIEINLLNTKIKLVYFYQAF